MASAHWLAAFFALGVAGCCGRVWIGHDNGTKTWGGPYVAIAAEHSATCAIERAGDVACWGDIRTGKPPAGPFREIGFNQSCAVGLRPTGKIEGWGPSCAAPPPGDFVAISVQNEACAIRNDGDIVCWELLPRVYHSPSGSLIPLPPAAPQVIRGLFTHVGRGYAHTCAIQAGGALRCWGMCTFRAKTTDCPATAPAPAGVWTAVASGDDFSCALSTAGEITCWGAPWVPLLPPSGKGFRAIAAHSDVACAIDARQEIQCWGRPVRWGTTTLAPPAGPFSALSVGGAHVCGLRVGGKVSCWGADQQGQVTGSVPWMGQ